MGAISVLIGVLIIVVVGAICFWVIDRFAPSDGRLQTVAQAPCRASLPWRHSAEVARTNVLDRQV